MYLRLTLYGGFSWLKEKHLILYRACLGRDKIDSYQRFQSSCPMYAWFPYQILTHLASTSHSIGWHTIGVTRTYLYLWKFYVYPPFHLSCHKKYRFTFSVSCPVLRPKISPKIKPQITDEVLTMTSIEY